MDTGFIPKNSEYVQVVRKKLLGQELMKHLNIALSEIKPGYTEVDMPFETIHQQQDGYVHGGLTGAVADIVSGFAAYTLVAESERVVTADIRTSYLRPGVGQRIWAKGWVVKPGKNFFFCEAEVYIIRDDSKVLIAKSSSTMAVIR